MPKFAISTRVDLEVEIDDEFIEPQEVANRFKVSAAVGHANTNSIKVTGYSVIVDPIIKKS